MAKKPLPADAPLLNTPFAALAAKRAELPAAPAAPPAPAVASAPKRAVVRYERKGHGGKEMTRVEQLGLPAGELARWLQEVKHGLGCGGSVQGDALLLSGDQRERLRTWLARRGVARVTVS